LEKLALNLPVPSCAGLSHPCIHLYHGQEDRKLTIGPPFGPPTTLQQNWSVTTFAKVIHPMLSLVMPQKRLGILERFPLTIDLSPGGVILVLIKNSVRQHYLHPLIGIMATMNEETRTLNILQVCLGLT
jgi:hypothetical protein